MDDPFLLNRINKPLFLLARLAAKALLSPIFHIHFEGESNLPIKKAFILLPKHQRWVDIPLLGLASPRPLYYMAKQELFLHFASRWFLSSLGGIPLNRSRLLESRHSLKCMIELLKDEAGLVVFPEGTYYVNRIGPGRAGLLKMIRARVNVPLIPVGIEYLYGGRRTMVRIHFGRPIDDDGTRSTDNLLKQIMAEIAWLSRLG